MKKIYTSIAVLLIAAITYSFTAPAPTVEGELKWYTWEEAVKANETNPKKFFVDIYTDWCGPCKMMNSSTLVDPKVVNYLTEHYYPVKLNAEEKANISYKGVTFKHRPEAGRRGIHELAYALLEGKMSYPSFVYLTPEHEKIMVSPGFKKADVLIHELVFAQEEAYKTKSWDEFMKGRVK